MKHFLSIAAFTFVVSMLYTGVGQVLPQLENRPPPEVKAGSNIGPEALAEAGSAVFEANCVQCHKIGQKGRGPNLANVGGRAASRAADRAAKTGQTYRPVDYLIESLCKPSDYIVDGFGNIMPPQGKALSGGQILAVASFLQSLGGDSTIKGTDTEVLERFGCGVGAAAEGGGAAKAEPVGKPPELVKTFGCVSCHAFDSPKRKLGPSLQTVGKRLSKGEIYEAVLDPDATIAKGDPPYEKGLMKRTLDGNGFYTRMKPGDYAALVDWLSKKK